MNKRQDPKCIHSLALMVQLLCLVSSLPLFLSVLWNRKDHRRHLDCVHLCTVSAVEQLQVMASKHQYKEAIVETYKSFRTDFNV
jgi:hypothetical protein